MLLLGVYSFLGLLGLVLVFMFVGVVGELSLLSFDLDVLGFYFLFDEVCSVFFLMLFCCGSMALFYCFHYFSGSFDGYCLFLLIVWFLGVMCFLVFSSSLVFTLVFWEYLGLVSFFLMLFYSKSFSMRASLVTLFASRFGDVSLFVLIALVSYFFCYSGVVFSVLFLLCVVTKSACFPFMTWLLEAMRAPTPVSSLVHSSTLVAAGIWFVYRYFYLMGDGVLFGLVYFSFMSMVISSFCSLVFSDLKKIVALSTCKKISWCILFFVFGDFFLSLVQLLSHGLCKCFLFMSVGDLMSRSFSGQKFLGVYSSRYGGLFLSFVQSFLVLCLSGVPVLGVFFSKHCFFSSLFYSGSLGCFVLFFFCLFMTYVYSVRFCLMLLGCMGGKFSSVSKFFLLICPLSFLGTFVKFFWSFCVLEEVYFDYFGSFLVFFIQVLGCFFGIVAYFCFFGGGRWFSMLWGSDSFVYGFYSWFVSSVVLFLFSVFRWEFFVLSKFSVFFEGFFKYYGVLFSLKFFVLCLLFFMGGCVFLS